MTLSYQVCSLEQAKKFKKLGLIQFSYVHYYVAPKNEMGEKKGQIYFHHAGTRPNSPKGWRDYYSAYTAAELGEMLPEWVYSKKNSGGGLEWWCMMVEGHKRMPRRMKLEDFYADTEAEVRAEMLIHLIKIKKVEIVRINKFLKKK